MSTRTEPSTTSTKQTLDELVANRTAQKLPAAPVFTREVVPVPEVGRGRKGASDLEAAIRANAEAAEEARRVALTQRRALEEVAAQRIAVEKQLAGLRREFAEERSEHERLVAQARFRATQEERRRHETTVMPGAESGADAAPDSVAAPARPSPALRAVQGQIAEREQLGESHRQRLLEALRERDAARLELQRVSDARTHAERRLERVTEVLHRATSTSGPHPMGDDGVETQAVRALRDELAVAIARAKSAESRTNELRDEIHAVKNQRVSTTESLEATRDDLDRARDELGSLHARLVEIEAEQRKGAPDVDRIELAQTRARALETEVEAARERAATAERQILELTASLQSTTDRAELSLSVTQDLQRELADAQRRAAAAESEAIELAARARQDVLVFEAQLDAALIEHGHHAVDLEATHAATAAELTSASAQAEHLAHQIEDAQERVGQLEAALAATTAELSETSDRLLRREVELAELGSDLSTRDARLEELEAAVTAAVGESVAARARGDEIAEALEVARRQAADTETASAVALDEAARAASVAEAALGTARAERDVAVAQADSLTLELDQRRTELEHVEAQAAERESEWLAIDTDHRDALQRLDELGRELANLRGDRDQLINRAEDMTAQCEHLELELGVARVRADDLEATRSEDRRVAEQAIEALRTKTETATARAATVESEMQELRSLHSEERDRLGRELDAVRARATDLERELDARRTRESLRHDAPSAKPTPAPASVPGASASPVTPPPVATPPDAAPADQPRAPSELRRAVFASLTELAGDG